MQRKHIGRTALVHCVGTERPGDADGRGQTWTCVLIRVFTIFTQQQIALPASFRLEVSVSISAPALAVVSLCVARRLFGSGLTPEVYAARMFFKCLNHEASAECPTLMFPIATERRDDAA